MWPLPDPLDRILIFFSLEPLVFNIQAKFEISSFSRSQDMRGGGLCLFASRVVCRLVFVSHEYSVRKVNYIMDCWSFAICCRPSICLWSVTFVCPTQVTEIFCSVSTAFGTLAIHWQPRKILWRSFQGNTSISGLGLSARGVAKYSIFRPFKGYI